MQNKWVQLILMPIVVSLFFNTYSMELNNKSETEQSASEDERAYYNLVGIRTAFLTQKNAQAAEDDSQDGSAVAENQANNEKLKAFIIKCPKCNKNLRINMNGTDNEETEKKQKLAMFEINFGRHVLLHLEENCGDLAQFTQELDENGRCKAKKCKEIKQFSDPTSHIFTHHRPRFQVPLDDFFENGFENYYEENCRYVEQDLSTKDMSFEDLLDYGFIQIKRTDSKKNTVHYIACPQNCKKGCISSNKIATLRHSFKSHLLFSDSWENIQELKDLLQNACETESCPVENCTTEFKRAAKKFKQRIKKHLLDEHMKNRKQEFIDLMCGQPYAAYFESNKKIATLENTDIQLRKSKKKELDGDERKSKKSRKD